MKFTLLAIGKIKEKWMVSGINEYRKRLIPIAKVEVKEEPEEKIPPSPSLALKEKGMDKEGEKLLRHVAPDDFVILLDTHGEEMSSEALADFLQKKMTMGTGHFYFLIGGPYGNGAVLRKRANLKISLGPMTLTHQMARLLLMEQLYRAMKINRHEPYHL